MLLALISLSSIALLASSFFPGEDHEDEEGSHEETVETIFRESENTDDSSDILQDNVEGERNNVEGERDNVEGEQDNGEMQLGEGQSVMASPGQTPLEDSSIVNILEAESASEQYDNQSTQAVHLMSVSGGIPPLTEWANNPQLEKVDLADVDSIFIENPNQLGSVVVMQADYFERLPSDDGNILHNIHSGANVYFVPEGDEFPEEYQWSESGASLSNTSTFSGKSDDFKGVKLILRIDTGYLHGDNESEQASEFKIRAFSELQEQFSSDGNFIFGTGPSSVGG